MFKNAVRDYAISAFRFYAKEGRPDPDILKQQILMDAYANENHEILGSKGIGKPTEAAVLRAEKELDLREAELLDIMAVHRTMERLNNKNPGIFSTVEIVYFMDPDKKLSRGELTMRVRKASVEVPASERQIYRWLSLARLYFAEERKLRQENSRNKKRTFVFKSCQACN